MSYKYCTYKFYTEDGRRIAAFAEETSKKDTLKISLFFCSRKDQFSRKKAQHAFNTYYEIPDENSIIKATLLYHPDIFTIKIDPKKPKSSFIQYMFSNYYVKKEKICKCWVDVLVGPKGKKEISSPKRIFNKMDAAW